MDLIQELYNIGKAYEGEAFEENNKINTFLSNKMNEVVVLSIELDSENDYIFKQKVVENDENIYLIWAKDGASAKGNLFPVLDTEKRTPEKIVKSLLTANKNLKESIKTMTSVNDETFKIIELIDNIDKEKLQEFLQENILFLGDKKENGIITKTIFTFTYNRNYITSYMKDIYKNHILNHILKSDKNKNGLETTCFLSNKKGINSVVNLPFSSFNELPKSLQAREKVLSFSLDNNIAGYIDYGYKVLFNKLSFSWGGIKVIMIPTLLNNNEKNRLFLLKKLQEIVFTSKNNNNKQIEDVKEIEGDLNIVIEKFINESKDKNIAILNSFLFYEQEKAKNDLLLEIDDVLPSYISKIGEELKKATLKIIPQKGEQGDFYLSNLYKSNIELFNMILSNKRLSEKEFFALIENLILNGGVNGKKVKWNSYFNQFYKHGTGRQATHIFRLNQFLLGLEKTDIQIFKKGDFAVQNNNNEKRKVNFEEFEQIVDDLENNVLLVKDSNLLKVAFYTGMLSSMLITFQKGQNSSTYNSTLANFLGTQKIRDIKRLKAILAECEDTINKINSYSNVGKIISYLNSLVLEKYTKLGNEKLDGAEISICFAIGGESAIALKSLKIETQGKENE